MQPLTSQTAWQESGNFHINQDFGSLERDLENSCQKLHDSEKAPGSTKKTFST